MKMMQLSFVPVLGTIFLLFNARATQAKDCHGDQFSCRDNSFCIPNSWKCDGVGDCPDSSDENSCGYQTTQSCGSDTLFRCASGKCILSSWTCDNDNDCEDNSDETKELCPDKPSCEFTCDNGKCLASVWVCDQFNDCGDGSDERNCSSTVAPTTVPTTASTTAEPTTVATTLPPSRCMTSEFECRVQSSCIPTEWKCDGSTDCEDGTDEEGCGEATTNRPTTSPHCTAGEFYCDDKCIPGTWKCDNFNDCHDGKDEHSCGNSTTTETPSTTQGSNSTITSSTTKDESTAASRATTELQTTDAPPTTRCLATEFECRNGRCIKREWLCDKVDDCQDNSDERDCGAIMGQIVTTPKSVLGLAPAVCYENQFPCASGVECTFNAWKCDGDEDCADGSDEQNCNSEELTRAPQPVITTCDRGYFTCLTSRQCIANHWVCDKERDCTDGSDEQGCVEAVSLLVAAGSKIVKVPEDLATQENVFTSLNGAVAIDIDIQTQEIFWSDVKRKEIRQGNINGYFSQAIISSNLGTVEGIAVDWVARTIYWTDSLLSTIEVAGLRGQRRTKLVTRDLSQPRAIAVYPKEKYLFWSEWGGQPKISRISMDGNPETRTVLIDRDIVWPNALTIDYQKANLFWADAKLAKIERCELDGSNRRVITERNVGSPFSVVVSSRYVYWTNWDNSRIERIEKDSWNKNQIQSQSFSSPPLAMTLIDGAKHEAVHTECSVNNGGCSHLCVLSSTRGYSCLCPRTMEIDRSGRKCVRRILASCRSPKQFHCDGKCIDVAKRCDGKPDCDDGTDEFYCLADVPRLLFTDRKKYIGLCTLQGNKQCSDFKEIEKTRSVIGIDVDVKKGIVYWADSKKNAIMKTALKKNGDLLWTKIVTDTYVYTPQGLALDWVTNKIYWIDRYLKKIEVIDTDGTYRKTLVNTNLRKPRSIALFPKRGYLYWTDWGTRPCVARISMDGDPETRRMVVETGIKTPNAITIDYRKEQLYWADSHLNMIERINVDGGLRTRFLDEKLTSHAFALTFYKDFIYWSDWHLQGIWRVGTTSRTKKQDSIVKKPILHPMELVVFDKDRQPAMRNPCAVYNGGCSHICLISERTKYSCQCPATMRLKKDKITCESLYRIQRTQPRTNSLFDIGLL